MLDRGTAIATILVIGFMTIGCADGVGRSVIPTAPSVSSLMLAAPSSSDASSALAGTSYNATGVWRMVIADQRSGEVYDDVDTTLTQHPDGTVTFCGECEGELFTLVKRGAGKGAAVPYELSYFGEGEPCNATLSGTAVLDTRRSVITAHGLQGTSDDCSRLLLSLTLTRQS